MSGFTPYLADVLAAYQPNPGLPNYNPNPSVAPAPAPAPPSAPGPISRAVGAVSHAFSSPDPLFQLPSKAATTPAQAPIDLGEIDAPTAPPTAPAPAAAPPGPEGPGPDASFGPPAPPPNVNGDFPLTLTGVGGMTPAREVDMRGPTLQAAQGAANTATGEAIGNVHGRNTDLAAHEYGMALDQERAARAREAAFEQSQAEREEELVQRQNDFDQSVKALSQTAIDPNRFWATRSTGQKVSALVGLSLGGFLQGARGGSNPGMDAINTAIDRDVRAQELAYHVARDVVNGRQTAFSMAMQKYQNADAARAMARAAAMDVVQAQMAQAQALGKGTDAANRADIAMAALQTDKMNQIAQGVRFILPQATGPVWRDKYGIPYNADQARGVANTVRASEEKREEIGLNTAGDIMKEQAKGAVTKQGQQVQLPNGDVVQAPSDKEAENLRGLSVAVSDAQQLVNEAMRIRQGTAWRVPGSSDRARLDTIQSELTIAFKNRAGLGALSGPDMELATGATGEITSQSSNAEARLQSFAARTNAALRNRVKTIPGAPGTAKGEMPKSFTPHGGK